MEVISGSGFLHSRDPIILFMWDIWRLLLVSCSSWGTKEKKGRKKQRTTFVYWRGTFHRRVWSKYSTGVNQPRGGKWAITPHEAVERERVHGKYSYFLRLESDQSHLSSSGTTKNCSKKSEKKLENHRRPSDAHTCISLFVLMSEESYRYQNLTGFLFFFFLRRAGWQVGWWNWVQPLLQ